MNEEKKVSKYDTFLVGILTGLLVPAIVFFIVTAIWFSKVENSSFEQIIQLGLATKFLSLATIPNLFTFFIFTCECRGWIKATKGLVSVTILLGILIFIFAV